MSRQRASDSSPKRPGTLLRLFFRAPVLLYRIGAGWLMFGQLQLTTVGRKTGLPRRTVVDVLGHDKAADTYHVISAYGATSDWLRNLEANDAVDVTVGRRSFQARATILPPSEAEPVFLDYWRRHRFYVSTMLRLVGLKAGTEEEAKAAASEMRLVSIQPVGEPS